MTIYLDNAATTQPDPRVVEVMLHHLSSGFGNAASPHRVGRSALAAVDKAREQIGALLGVRPRRLVFTSGATEAINAAIKGTAATAAPGSRLVVTAVEHKAVLDTADAVARLHHLKVIRSPVGADGIVDLDALQDACIPGETALVAVMAANNETGAIQPSAEATQIAHAAGAPILCDATQIVGKDWFDLDGLDVDFAAASAHKIHGPQGVGVLVMPRQVPHGWEPLLHGGGHERGYRSGTLNVPGIAGFGEAARIAAQELEAEQARVSDHRNRIEEILVTQLSAIANGTRSYRVAGITNLRIPEVDSEALVTRTPGVAFATGSACTSRATSPSHVLLAMGLDGEAADQSIRLSIGRYTTVEDIQQAAGLLCEAAMELRAATA